MHHERCAKYHYSSQESEPLDGASEDLESGESSEFTLSECETTSIGSKENIRPCIGSEEEGEGEFGPDPDSLMPLNAPVIDRGDIKLVDKHLEFEKSKYSKLFQNDHQLEFFLMLPLSKQQRIGLLEALAEEGRQTDK